MKEFRNPGNVHAPLGGYTHQIEISGPERILVLSGQVGQREDGSLPEGWVEQLEVALNNLKRNLQAAQMEIDDIVKITFYLVGQTDAAQRRQVIGQALNDHRPCMTLIYVAGLATPAHKVEIDAWASKAA